MVHHVEHQKTLRGGDGMSWTCPEGDVSLLRNEELVDQFAAVCDSLGYNRGKDPDKELRPRKLALERELLLRLPVVTS